jgi:hypothetical protein
MDAKRRERRRRADPPTPGFLNRLATRVFVALLLLSFGYFAWRYVAVDRLDEEIRQRVEARFREHYHGLIVTVDAARRLEGEGVEIRGLTIREVDSGKGPPLLHVERIFAACNTSLPEFVTKEPEVTRIVVQRAKVHAVRRRSGFWNARHLFPPPQWSDRNPPILFDDCSVEFADESHPEATPHQWRSAQLTLMPDAAAADSLGLAPAEAPRAIRLSGSMMGDHFRTVRLEGAADLPSNRWRVLGEVEGLEFNPAMREGLPRDLAAELAPIAAVSGNTQLRFEVDNLAGPDAPVRFNMVGEITGGRIDDERLPQPLTDVTAKMRADNHGLRIDDLRARLGAASLELSLQLEGYESTSPMVLRVAASDLLLNDRLVESLPEESLKLWRELSPTGLASGSVMLEFDGRTWRPTVSAEFSQLALMYRQFPLRLTDGTASLKLRNDLLTMTGQAWAGNSPVRVEAEIRNVGPEWSGWLEARSEEPMPIDDRLLAALQPIPREIAQAFNARGAVQLLGRMDRRAGARTPPHMHVEVALSDCSLSYRHFQYPIDHVSGLLRGSDGVWSFVNLKGSQGTTQISASGGYGPDGTRGPLLNLDLRCENVTLDDTLRRALTPEGQRLWNDVRPRGEIDVLGVNVKYRPATHHFELAVDGQKIARPDETIPRTVRVEPVWFPYTVDITSGMIRYRDGTLQLSNLRGVHGKTKLEAQGLCHWDSSGMWSIDLERVNADRLQLDHDLLAALPSEAGSALAKAKFSGTLGMTGQVNLSGRSGDVSSLDADWDFSFDVEDGRLAGDTPISEIHGDLQVRGGVSQGCWFSRGEMKVDSMFVRDVQVTRLQGPLYIDAQQLLIGANASSDVKGLPRRVTAQVFDGSLAVDGSFSLEDDGKFKIESTLEQASLAKIAQEFGSTADEISGKAYATLAMTGTTRGKHTWRGVGNVQLREAYLYKVPMMVAMLKLLSIRNPDATAFTSSDIEYRLQGDDVILDRIDLSGDAVTLRGRGRLFEQRQVDLMFYTQVGRRDLQAIRPLIAEASPHFLLIEVTGTIDQPNVQKTAFPVINETLRELFPDLARGEAEAKAERAGPTLVPNFWRR